VRIGVLLTAVALAVPVLSGCTAASDPPKLLPAPPQVRPAALAGGACQLIQFGTLEKILGQRYTIAAAAKKDTTNTCVVRTEAAAVPEIAVSVTPSKADAKIFNAVVKPKGATAVKGIGKVAYEIVTPGKAPNGPLVEVGWLTGDARLLFLRCTLPAGADPAAEGPKLVALAKELDKSSL
jgi:hypothetical protein